MTASPIAKAIHGATTIRSVPVIRITPTAGAFTISAPGGRAGPVKLTW
jgi:hypothetical protein